MNIASILTYVLTSVFALEQSFPQGGLGKTKKEIIMNSIQTLVKATATETATLAGAGSNVGTNTAINSISTVTSDFIDKTVEVLNKNKLFAK